MSIVAHFLGGPRDGERLQINRALNSIEVFIEPQPMHALSDEHSFPMETVTYWRSKFPSKRGEDGESEEWEYVYITPGRE